MRRQRPSAIDPAAERGSAGVRLSTLLEVIHSLGMKSDTIVPITDLEVVFSDVPRRTLQHALRILEHQGAITVDAGGVRRSAGCGFAPVSYTQVGPMWSARVPQLAALEGSGASQALALASLRAAVASLRNHLLRAGQGLASRARSDRRGPW